MAITEEHNQRILAAFMAVPEHIRDQVEAAAKWARETLRDREGAGHDFYVTAAKDGGVVCSFAKPEWAGDHCGRSMEHGAEAIVMAVCEYINGA